MYSGLPVVHQGEEETRNPQVPGSMSNIFLSAKYKHSSNLWMLRKRQNMYISQ